MTNITYKHVGMTLLAMVTVFVTIPFVLASGQQQLAIIFLIPGILTSFYIFMSPYFGTFMFYLFDYVRPADIITPLRTLHLPLIIEILTLLSWVFYLIKSKLPIRWNYFNWVYLAFLIVVASTVITAINNRRALDTSQIILVNFMFLIIASNVITTAKRLRLIIWLFMLATFYFAIRGLYNYAVLGYVASGVRTSGIVGSGYIGDENDFALAIVVMIPFAFNMFMHSKGFLRRTVFLAMLVVFVMAVVASMSRGGWLGLVAVGLFCILRTRRRIRTLALALLLSGVVFYFAPPEYWAKLKTIFNTDEGTAYSRINYWRAAMRMFKDYPITGVGAENGGIRMPEYISGVRNPYTQWGRTFHGTIPQLLAELGALGLACYLAMLYLALRQLLRLQKRKVRGDEDFPYVVANSIIGGILAYFVTATFLSTAYYPQLWILYMLTFALNSVVQVNEIGDDLAEYAVVEEPAVVT